MHTDAPFSFPFDILHVSDTHFLASERGNGKRAHAWTDLLDDVSQRIADREFRPDLIAFTGDLIESAVGRAPRAMRNGIHALLELAKRCGFLDRVPPQASWPQTLPPEWWALLNRRIVMVPGNHDVFCWGLRNFWHRRPSVWQRAVYQQHASPLAGGHRFDRRPLLDKLNRPVGRRALLPEGDCAIGPLAVRLIDCSGSRALWGTGTCAYEPALGGGEPWSLSDTDARFGVALVHGHPIELPFFLHGMFDGARGMVMENAGLLMKALAQLNIRLVLHGHRHYPGTWGVTLPDRDGDPKPLVVVGAGSPTKPPGQWRKYSYNWVRIHPDRKVKVTIVERALGERVFVLSPNQPFVPDRGDFWYERLDREIVINDAGDVSAEVVAKGFRVVPGRPSVRAIPFRIDPSGFGRLAAWQFTTVPVGDRKLSWTHDRSVVSIEPPYAAEQPPLDLRLRHYLHNAMCLNAAEAHEMNLEGEWEWTQHALRCETGALSLAVTLPGTAGALTANDYAVEVFDEAGQACDDLGQQLTKQVSWCPETRVLRVDSRHLPLYGTMRLRWRLKRSSTDLGAELQRDLRGLRQWQSQAVAAARKGVRALDALGELVATCAGFQDVDVTVFVPDLRGLRTGPDADMASNGRFVVAGRFPRNGSAEMQTFAFGEGIAGRALRTCRLHIHDVVPESERLQAFEQHRTPSNLYRPEVDGQEYARLLMIPVIPATIRERCRPDVWMPQIVTVGLCLASRDPTTVFVTASDDTLVERSTRIHAAVDGWVADAMSKGNEQAAWLQQGAKDWAYEHDAALCTEHTRAFRIAERRTT